MFVKTAIIFSFFLRRTNGLRSPLRMTVPSPLSDGIDYSIHPSSIALHNANVRIGEPWSYSELIRNIEQHNVDGAAFLPKGNGLIAIDNHYIDTLEPNSLHSVTLIPGTSETLIDVLTKNHVNTDVILMPVNMIEQTLNFLGNAIPVIFGLYVFVNFAYMMYLTRQQGPMNGRGGKNNMFQMGPTTDTGNMIDANTVNTTFVDVAGCDEAKYELMEVVDFLKNSDKYKDAGAKIPKGVLLEGSPGTGKTLMARAVAGEAGVPFISASGSEFIEVFVGVGASRVRELFQKARDNAPCVIFIDEVDAIGRQRGAGIAGGNDEREQKLNQILTNMDGFDITDGIVVIAATNRADILDNALTRPGRFDRKVNVPLPDTVGRKAIANVHFKNKNVGPNVDIEELATLTTGFSGAEIANLANEAAIIQVRKNETEITRESLLDAFEKVTIGLPSNVQETNEDIIELVSYHETGHALMACLFPDFFEVRKVTINANKGGAGGYTLFTPYEKYSKYATKKFMLANLIVALGGRAAEVYLYRKTHQSNLMDSYIFKGFEDLDITTGASNDLIQANRIAKNYITQYGFGKSIGQYDDSINSNQPFVGRSMGMSSQGVSDATKYNIDEEVADLVNFAYLKAVELIRIHENVFLKTVDLLKSERTISGDDIQYILTTMNGIDELSSNNTTIDN